MLKLVAMWNTARGVWEKPETENLICGHLELFSGTWMTSGTMRNGVVYELPMQGHPTSVSGFSSSPGGGGVSVPTPTASDSMFEGLQRACTVESRNRGVSLPLWANRIELLRTPKASDGQGGALGEAEALKRGNSVGIRDQVMDLVAGQGHRVSRADLPLPATKDSVTGSSEWGRFGLAVKHWEGVTGMKTPAPTKPDGKDGAHRLSSEFTEWMMGLPNGWVTGLGLSRKDELKACGNGVVPQQAELALRLLLEGKK